MGKPTICLGENKGADQLRSNCEADQRLCFRYSDNKVPLLLKSEISRFWLFSVLVQAGLCRTCSETTLLVFPYIDKQAATPENRQSAYEKTDADQFRSNCQSDSAFVFAT